MFEREENKVGRNISNEEICRHLQGDVAQTAAFGGLRHSVSGRRIAADQPKCGWSALQGLFSREFFMRGALFNENFRQREMKSRTIPLISREGQGRQAVGWV